MTALRIRKFAAAVAVGVTAVAGVVALSSPASADSAPQITVNDVTALKPTSGTASEVFTIRLAYTSLNTVSVNYATSDQSAHSTHDYQATSGTAKFAPGTTTQSVSVTINGDTLDQGNRTFGFNLSGAVNGAIVRSSGTGTIIDDTPSPYVNVGDTAVVNGYAGTTTASFPVSLTSSSANTVTVHYNTADNVAHAGINYTATSGTLTFAPGQTAKTVSVPILGKTTPESAADFYLYLNNAINARIENNTGRAIIQNPDRSGYLTVDDSAVTKPSSGTTTMTFPVRLIVAATLPVTVGYATQDGTATTAAGDYTQTQGTLTFAPGTTSQNVTVPIAGNAATGNKNFYLSLSAPSAGSVLQRSLGTGVIIGTAGYAQLSVNDTAVVRPTSGTGSVTVSVTLKPASASTVTVNYATSDGSAVSPGDYTSKTGTLSFPAGSTTQTVSVPITSTTLVEPDNYFNVGLSSPSGATVVRSPGYVEILGHAVAPYLTASSAAAAQPSSGSASIAFPVTLSASSPNTVTVKYQTSDGSATSGTKYGATSGTLTFNPGVTSMTVSVPLMATTVAGPTTYFYLNLSSPTNAAVTQPSALAEVLDYNYAPTLSINDSSVYRGTSGSTALTFTATLSAPSSNTITAHYSTSDGSAGAGVDYTSASGTVTFTPGVTSVSIPVSVLGNTLTIPNRYFYLTLSAPTNTTIVSSTGVGTIVQDVILPYLSVSNPTVVKGASATTEKFTITLSNGSSNAVSANYTTSNGSAVAGADYTATSGTISIPAGQTTATVNVPVFADTAGVTDKYFYLYLSSPVSAQLSTSYGVGTILTKNITPGLSIGDVSVKRPTSGSASETFTVTLSPTSVNTVTANYATSDGSAVAGTDYTATSGSVSFAPGQISKTVTVPITASNTSQADKYFYLYLSAPANAQLVRSYGVGYLVNQVAPVTARSYVTVSDAVVAGGAAGTATFTVSLAPAASSTVFVNYATSDGTAVAGIDYTAVRGTLTFTAGQTSKTVTVPTAAIGYATSANSSKYFTLGISSATTPGSIERSSGEGLLLNTNASSRVSVGPDLSVIKGDSGSRTLNFTVTLSSAQTQPVSVDVATADGSALAPDSYTPVSNTITFAPGETSIIVPVTVLSSTTIVPTQYFSLGITDAVHSALGDSTAYGYIYNADVFSIKGVVSAPSGTPIAGVRVTRTGNNQPSVSTVTASDGTYTIPNAINGSYTLTPALSGQSFYPTKLSTTVRGATSSNQLFIGYTGNAIAGRVVLSTQSAVSGATVTRTGGGQSSATTTSNASGYYVFGSVPNGTSYVVTASKSGYVSNPASYTVSVSGATVSSLDALLVQPAYITGRVVNSGGTGVSGVTLTRTGGGQPTTTVTTDSQGYYGFTAQPASPTAVSFTITPTQTGHTFSPTSAAASISTTTNASGINFTQG